MTWNLKQHRATCEMHARYMYRVSSPGGRFYTEAWYGNLGKAERAGLIGETKSDFQISPDVGEMGPRAIR